MKIIQINASYKPAYIYGGPTMSVSKLSEELAKAGIDLTVLTTTANGTSELPVTQNEIQLVDGVKVRYFKRLTKDHTHFSPSLLWALRSEIRQHKAESGKEKEGGRLKLKVESDQQPCNLSTLQPSNNPSIQQSHELIIHIHAWWNLVSMLSGLIALIHRVPIVISPRGMLTSYTLANRNSLPKAILHWLIGKRVLANSEIHATSEKEAQDISATTQVKKITIVPNFVRFPKELPAKKINDDPIYKLLFLSRLEEKKGLELLFEALAQLNFDWQLQIAGTGEEAYVESLKGHAERLKLSDRLIWLGLVNDQEKFELIAANDLFVLTSYNENFANVVIESLSVGTAVLLSNQVGLAAYVEKNNLGWITDLTIDQISSTLQSSFEEKDKRANIRNHAPFLIQGDFNEDRLVKQYIDMYQNLSLK